MVLLDEVLSFQLHILHQQLIQDKMDKIAQLTITQHETNQLFPSHLSASQLSLQIQQVVTREIARAEEEVSVKTI